MIDGWSSHTPILKYLAKKNKITRILETGLGKYSTSLFLNKEFFPDLIELVSIEDSKEWIDKTEKGDNQIIIQAEVGKVFEEVRKLDLSKFDLIFIDDSKSENLRSNTIREVAKKKPTCFVVVHDYHREKYQKASEGFKFRLKIDNYEIPGLPKSKVSTGLLHNHIDVITLKNENSFFQKEE